MCDSAVAKVTVGSVIVASDDALPPVVGGGNTPSVLTNDTLNGTLVTPATVTLTPGIAPNPGVKMNPDGTVTVDPKTPPGAYSYPYTICSKVDPTVCDPAIAIVNVGSVVNAVDDAFGTVAPGASTTTVLTNDTLNGNPTTPTTVTVTPGTSPNVGLVMNADGTITIAATTPPGVYGFPYSICSKVDPTVCDAAIATMKVASVVKTVDDSLPVLPDASTVSVLVNDTLNGTPVSLTTVTLIAGTSPSPNLVMDPDGTIAIAANTPPGVYSYPYTICSKVDPTVCSTAIAKVTVGAVIKAVDDPFGTLKPGTVTGSVLNGDTVNGLPATLTNVTLTPGPSPDPGLVMNGDGTITVGSTPPGTYIFPYTICAVSITAGASHLVEALAAVAEVDPEGCSTGTATLTVSPIIDATPNLFATRRNPSGPTKTPSVLENDSLNGLPVSLDNVVLSAGVSPLKGITMNADGTITVDKTVPAGEYHYPYTICSVADPTICKTTEAVLTVQTNRLPTTGSNPHTVLYLAVGFVLAGSAFGLFGRRRRARR
jgi:large repetitive protein